MDEAPASIYGLLALAVALGLILQVRGVTPVPVDQFENGAYVSSNGYGYLPDARATYEASAYLPYQILNEQQRR